MNKTQRIMLVIGGVLVVGAVIWGLVSLFGSIGSGSDNRRTAYMEELGEIFYPRFHEEQGEVLSDEELRNMFESWSETGFNINIDGLRHFDEDGSDRFEKLFEGCDLANTTLTLYPEAPFGPNDFRMTTEINC